MRLDRRRLEDILQILGTAVGNKVMEVANYICVKIDKNLRSVVFMTTNFHAFLAVDFGDVTLAGIEDMPEIFLIDYRILNAVIKNSTTEMVQFSDDGNSIVVTTDGRYVFKKFENVQDFPSADFTSEFSMKWPVPSIVSAWNKAGISVSKDVTKINYQGVYFDGNLVATDNRRMSVVRGNEYQGPPMLIPPIFGNILKHCKNEVIIGVNPVSSLIIAACPEIGLMSGVRLIDAKFVDYVAILDIMNSFVTVTVDKQLILGAISRLLPFTDKMFKVVEIEFIYSLEEKHRLRLSVDNKHAGEELILVKNVDIEDDKAVADLIDKNDGDFVLVRGKYQIDNVHDGVSVVESPEDVDVYFQEDGKLWIIEEAFTYLQTSIQ